MYTYLFMSNYTHTCDSLPIDTACSCCFSDLLLYASSLSTIGIISSLFVSELFPACLFRRNFVNLLHNFLRSGGKNMVFDLPDAEIFKPGDLSNHESDLSQLDLLPEAFTSKHLSFAKSYIYFLSNKLARSAL